MMQRLGTVVRTAQNLAIVRCPDENHPDIGLSVIDEELNTVGRVVDVFGPVDQPYLAVAPKGSRRLAELLGTKLYTR